MRAYGFGFCVIEGGFIVLIALNWGEGDALRGVLLAWLAVHIFLLLPIQVANKIAVALEAAKRSVKWLSDQSGTPYATLRRQLSGKASISIGQIAVYADCLCVEPMTMLPDSFTALAGKEVA